MHYRMYLRGLSPFALIQNVTFYATDGPDSSGVDRLILTKAFGMPNGPSNPSGGFGVPANGTTWVLTTYIPTSASPLSLQTARQSKGGMTVMLGICTAQHLQACCPLGFASCSPWLRLATLCGLLSCKGSW